MSAPFFSSFCALKLSRIVLPLKFQTRSYLMNMQYTLVHEKTFLLILGRVFPLDAHAVWETCLQAALASWILVGVAIFRQQTWSSLLGFLRDTGGLLKVHFHFTISMMLCVLSVTERLSSLLRAFFFFPVCSKKLPCAFTQRTILLWSNASVNILLQRGEENMGYA